ncbi:hypothetical protein ACE38W_00880 [Chitinophaga sp. Hz27]|uniref:hypothetical protein n=1 Tax=Chitinophaga sp. Hz27 TaxID=3347169 RepID=UPI0035DEC820
MATLNKIIMGTAIGAGVVAVFSYFARIRRASVQLEVIPNANIHTLSLTGLTIRIDAVLKNPTAAAFSVKFPYVKITHKGTLLGSSQVINKDIRIPAYGQVVINEIMVEMPPLSFFSVAYDIIKTLNNKQSIVLTVQTLTTIDLGWSKIPYEDKKEITLKK